MNLVLTVGGGRKQPFAEVCSVIPNSSLMKARTAWLQYRTGSVTHTSCRLSFTPCKGV